ncbi:MAG: PQQ-like beta-propeller repeat protein, partial [Acidobacteriota bacterium]|nr:PQQ-like beta-propeller repeat protein [Acidobacteriota bacterium]
AETARQGTERVLALEENSGRQLWSRSWKADYTGLSGSYAIGPRATPTVDGSRVYVLGAKGALYCLRTDNGEILWQKDFVRDYGTEVPVWGMVGAPLVDGPRLIAVVGGQDGAKVVAFDKKNGREVWRALPSDSEPGYAPPIVISAGGRRQLIVWHPKAVSALDPATGKVLWQQPFHSDKGLSVATPVFSGSRLLVSAFVNGSMMLDLDRESPAARLLWRGKSDSEIDTDTLHSLISTPVIDGDTLYGVCSYGHLRGLSASTGKRLWETLAVTGEKARWATAFLVRHQDRYFISNDRGELIIARLSPSGYREIDRTHLIAPTSRRGIGRRQAGAVNWSHPAYANRHIFARNDREIIRASLARIAAAPK